MPNTVYIDFESKSASNLPKEGAHKYSKHPTTDILCLGHAIKDEAPLLWRPGMPNPERLFDEIENGAKIVGHNIGGFEVPIWNNVCTKKYGWPKLPIEQCEDTMVMSYAMAIPGRLEGAAAALGISKQKDMKGNRVMLQISQPRKINPDGSIVWWDDPDKFEIVFRYCLQDVEVERELYKRLVKLSDFERKVWLLDQKINSRGVRVDIKAAKAAFELIEYEKNRLDEEMRRTTNHNVATCKAVSQLTNWIKDQGVNVESIAKAEVTSLLTDRTLPENIKKALRLRQEAAKSSTAKIESMLNRAGTDNKLRGLFQYSGAGTRRWAGRGVQLQNLVRSTISQEEIEDVFRVLGEVKA